MDWEPNEEWAPVIKATNEILREYSQYGPMTVRQIFYRLVGKYGFKKDERAYKNLVNNLVKARRAQLVRFSAIRDDSGRSRGGPHGDASVRAFLDDFESQAANYYRDTFLQQPSHIVIFCEAAGLVDMVAEMVSRYRIQVTGTGGFASVTLTHNLAQQVVRRKVPTHFLHVGDHDPSGVSIFESMSQDIGKFAAELRGASYTPSTGETHNDDGGWDFKPLRVALHEEQVEEYRLETAPPKASDSRSANWVGETTQLEALAPDDLEKVIKSAIDPLVDWPRVYAWERLQDAEDEVIQRVAGPHLERLRNEILAEVDEFMQPDFEGEHEDADEYDPKPNAEGDDDE